jgi:hypothetical protein
MGTRPWEVSGACGDLRSRDSTTTYAPAHLNWRPLENFPTITSTADARVSFAMPRTYKERSSCVVIDLRNLGFLTSTIRVPGGCRQRQLWSASHLGVGSALSLLLRWVNAYISKRSAPASAAPGLGEGIRSPTVLRR